MRRLGGRAICDERTASDAMAREREVQRNLTHARSFSPAVSLCAAHQGCASTDFDDRVDCTPFQGGFGIGLTTQGLSVPLKLDVHLR